MGGRLPRWPPSLSSALTSATFLSLSFFFCKLERLTCASWDCRGSEVKAPLLPLSCSGREADEGWTAASARVSVCLCGWGGQLTRPPTGRLEGSFTRTVLVLDQGEVTVAAGATESPVSR